MGGNVSQANQISQNKNKLKINRIEITKFYQKFSLEEQIGTGSYGQVVKVTPKSTDFIKKHFNIDDQNVKCAIKIILNEGQQSFKEAIEQEMQFLKLKNKNIVEYFDVFAVYDKKVKNQQFIHVAMELCQGDFAKYLEEQSRWGLGFQRKEQIGLMRQLAMGLQYLHGLGIAHRDLKLSNILVKKNGDDSVVLKISDFGTTKKMEFLKSQVQNFDASTQGTKLYWPYEFYNVGVAIDYFKQDIFALGIIFLIIIATPSIKESDLIMLKHGNNFNFVTTIEKYCKKCSTGLEDMLHKTLSQNPNQRPSCQEVLGRNDQLDIIYGRKVQFRSNKKGIFIELESKKINELIGKFIFENGNVYEGDIVLEQFHGNGQFRFNNGDNYKGQFFNDLRHGKGKQIFFNQQTIDNLTIQGGIRERGRNITDQSQKEYEGEWYNDKMEGKGKCLYQNGDIYEGEFKDNKKNGKGVYKFKSGEIYDGNWKNDKFEGQGKLTYKQGDYYQGEFKDGMKMGKGKMISGNNKQIYEGEFYQNLKHGYGVEQIKGQHIYRGQWVKDKKEGRGNFKNLVHGKSVDGLWINGIMENKLSQQTNNK